MIVNSELKFVFVSITKCGSESINRLLIDTFGGTRHGNVKKLIDYNNLNYYKFTVSRNPYMRMISWWWSTCKIGGDRYGHKKELKNAGLSESLFDFLTLWESKSHNGHPQVSWLTGNPKMDKIIKLENIKEFNTLPFISSPLTIPKYNSRVHPPWKELLDEKSLQLINKMYCDDFVFFNYEMEKK